MTNASSIQRQGELPSALNELLQAQDWAGLVERLDGGMPVNLVALGDVPLFEHVLMVFEAFNRQPSSASVAPAPLPVLEAFLRHGLAPDGYYEGKATAVSMVLNYGQWAWANRLLDEGFPVEGDQASVLLSLIDGRLQRAIAASPSLGLEDQDLPPELMGLETPENESPTREPAPSDASLWGLQGDTAEEKATLVALVARLVEKGAELERADVLGDKGPPMTPLLLAISHLDVTLIEALLKAGANATLAPPGWMLRPIDWAIQQGSVAVVHTLVANGVPLEPDPALPPGFDLEAHPLVRAAHVGRASLMEPLAAGVSQSDLAFFGTMAMHKAAACGHVDCMQALRLLRIPFNAQSSAGTVPMHQAARTGSEPALAFLLRRGQKWDSPANHQGETPGDTLLRFHPELGARFGLSLPENVRPLFGRRSPR
jgi:hypothetical protein